MSARLLRDQVAAHLATLRRAGVLTPMQSTRLDAVLGTLGGDGQFLLRDALELEARKAQPDRRQGWFTGGELVDEGIATFTAQAAGRTDVAHPVAQSVADLSHASVYVSHAPDDARHTADVLRELDRALALDGTRSWTVTHTGSVDLGDDFSAVRDGQCTAADIRVALVSPAYLTGDVAERDRACTEPMLAFAVRPIPDVPLAGPLRTYDVHRRHAPWEGLSAPRRLLRTRRRPPDHLVVTRRSTEAGRGE